MSTPPENHLPAPLKAILCLDDFEEVARRRLPRPLFGYIAGAAERNRSASANRSSFDAYAFVPRVMRDVSKRSTAIELFGQSYDAPIGIAPMGLSAMMAYRGDVALAQAAASSNIPMIMSGSSLIRLEELSAYSPKCWFQAYLPGEPEMIRKLIARVRSAGFETLVVTVDTPVAANRENNIRTGFSTPLRPSTRLALDGISRPRWLLGTLLRTLVNHGMPHFENNHPFRGPPIVSRNVERDFSDRGHLTWEHLSMVRDLWPGTLVLKGVLNAQDAATAVSRGVDGIIVSNHGGRQLDGAIAPLAVLPEIVGTCPNLPVMIDSGIRRGTDVMTAMALGAKCAFVGRPFLYAAAVGGRRGVQHGIDLLRREVSRNLALIGATTIEELSCNGFLRRLDNREIQRATIS